MIQGRVESIAFGGAGIVRHEGLVIFVPFTAPGDLVHIEIVQQKKNFAIGKLIRLLDSAPSRVSPSCSYFGTCGGCQLQHLNYSDQLEAKRRFIAESLKRIGNLSCDVPPVIPAEEQWAYRRHIKLNLHPKDFGFEMGYMHSDGLSLLPVDHCPIFHPREYSLLKELSLFLRKLSSKGIEKGTVRVLKTEPHTILAFSFSPKFPDNRKEQIESFLKDHPNWGVIIDSEHYGKTTCQLTVDGLILDYAPYGFLQNHPEQSLKLYQAIVAAVPSSAEKVLDLFCGIGISSLLLAKAGREVVGVEIHRASVELAQQNKKRNQVAGVRFIEGNAEMIGKQFLQNQHPDCVVVNPPRTGLMRSLVEDLIRSPVRNLIYVSCMPSTLSRDLNLLSQGGFQIAGIQGFDMFPQTTHVETLIKLSR